MKYKLVCCDLDGTLVDGKGNIPESNRKVIEELEAEGVIFSIATGRVLAGANLVADLLEINPYIICCCGAIVQTKNKGELLKNDYFSSDEIEEFIKLKNKFPEMNLSLNFINGCVMSFREDNYEILMYEKLNRDALAKGISDDQMTQLIYDNEKHDKAYGNFYPTNKVGIWTEDEKMKDRIWEELLKMGRYEMTSGMPTNIELTKKGIDKWSGVEILMKRYEIKQDEVICIGDSLNDSAMLKKAGLSIAMENACEELKKIADVITDTNENAGVAKVLHECLQCKYD